MFKKHLTHKFIREIWFQGAKTVFNCCIYIYIPQVFTHYLPLTFAFSCLYRDYTKTEHAFFARGVERWRKDVIHLWGSLNICPHLNHLELPHHSLEELHSICKLKVWGNIQEPCSNIAYLLVCTGDNLEAQDHGMSLVWVSPNQVQVPTMEEVVGTLSAYISSGPNWPYALAQLYGGSSHTPLPKDKHLGILPQGKAEGSPYEKISQLEVCQFLSTRPQVVYPVGLNGTNEPVTTTLPEQLHSSASVITYEHPYMRIDIPPPPLEELGHPTLLVDEVNTIAATKFTQTPQNQESAWLQTFTTS